VPRNLRMHDPPAGAESGAKLTSRVNCLYPSNGTPETMTTGLSSSYRPLSAPCAAETGTEFRCSDQQTIREELIGIVAKEYQREAN
jgi:hypothetical protein